MGISEARLSAQLTSARVGALSLTAAVLIALLRVVHPFPGSEHLYYLPIAGAAVASRAAMTAVVVASCLGLSLFEVSPGVLPVAMRAAGYLGVAVVAGVGRRLLLGNARAELSGLGQIMVSIIGSLNLEEVLSTIARAAAEGMGAKACSFRLLSDDGRRLLLSGTHGLSERYLQKGPVEVALSPVDQQVLGGRVVIVSDPASDRWFQYPEETRHEGIGSVICAPIRADSEMLGVMRVYGQRPHQFTPADAHFVELLGEQAGRAIKNARLYGDMRDRYQRLDAVERVKSEYLRRVSHELRSPLAAMQSSLQLLLKGLLGPMPDKQRDMVETAARRGESLLALLNDMLLLARTRSEAWQCRVERLPLAEVLGKITHLYEAMAVSRQVQVVAEVPSDLPIIMACAEELEEMLSNLVANAIRYTPAGGSVRVTARRDGERVFVRVEDTGIGIAEEDLPRVFDEFYRADNARHTQKEGTGLGLAVVRSIAEMHGGTVTVQSRVGEGSVFEVSLPVSLAGVEAGQQISHLAGGERHADTG
jgi:signal transduction histidine kinase